MILLNPPSNVVSFHVTDGETEAQKSKAVTTAQPQPCASHPLFSCYSSLQKFSKSFPFQVSLSLSGMSGELTVIFLSTQRWRQQRLSPDTVISWLVPLVALVPKLLLDLFYSRQQSGEIPLPFEPLASSLSTWEVPDSSLPTEGGVQNFPQSICIPAHPLLPI